MDLVPATSTAPPPIDASAALKDKLFILAIEAAKNDFLSFVKLLAPLLIPEFKMGRHIELVCRELQDVFEGKNKRLMLFLSPRSTKSWVASKFYPAWYLGHHPRHEIITVSHNSDMAADFGRSVRDIIGMEIYQRIFPGVELRQDVRAAGKWQTSRGGIYIAAGVKSQIAGRGAHIAVLDDVMSEEDAFTEAGRKYVKDWYPSGLRTRLMPGGAIIIINTRYHEDDLCGWLLSVSRRNEWRVIKIPAWLDETSAKLLGLPKGTSYFPEWKPDEILRLDEEEIKRANGSRYWQALYMQDPVPLEGNIIKKEDFKWWKAQDPPKCDLILLSMDTAFSTKESADFSVIQTWGIFGTLSTDSRGIEYRVGNAILLGSIRGRMEYPELRKMALEAHKKHKPDVILIEKKASGQSLIQDLQRAGLPVKEYLPDKDKESRVHAITPMLEAGRVWLPERSWAHDLVNEAVGFPAATHDDQVDCMVQALLFLRDGWQIEVDYREPDKPVKRKNYFTALTEHPRGIW